MVSDFCLAMRIDPRILIRWVCEFLIFVDGPVMTFAIPDPKAETYRCFEQHLNLVSITNGSTLNCCTYFSE